VLRNNTTIRIILKDFRMIRKIMMERIILENMMKMNKMIIKILILVLIINQSRYLVNRTNIQIRGSLRLVMINMRVITVIIF